MPGRSAGQSPGQSTGQSTGRSRGSSPGAELSSLSTALDDIRRRVTSIAEGAAGTDLDWLATNLFEVERSLGEATRRLGTITAGLSKRA